MKVIAYFLPQFHEIKENNEWWGEGFTEWTNVKKAKKLYSKHYQPTVPLNKNYYNLLEKETMIWQSQLANSYGIYGFCYYHYWFEGRKILEKPVENLLKWKEVKQNFCFCWANHSWKKTWKNSNEILLKQEYGDEKNWEEHIEYLISFFKDERYIKVSNKPLFVIFKPEDIVALDNMILLWEKKCKEAGFEGIHIVETKTKENKLSFISQKSSAMVIREPDFSMNYRSFYERSIHKIKRSMKYNYLFFVQRYNYEKFVKYSIKAAKQYANHNIYLGAFTGWDNTPRHSRRGYVIEKNTPNLFYKYLLSCKEIMENKKIEYIFINAWNEWAEGMYLEPEERFKYGYLEAIKNIVKNE